MNNKSILVVFLSLIILFLYRVFNNNIMSYTSIVLISIFTLVLNLIYFIRNPKHSKILIIMTLISTIIFNVYIVIGLNTNPPQNIGDFSLIPILLFIISVPLIVTMHLILIIKIFSNWLTLNLLEYDKIGF